MEQKKSKYDTNPLDPDVARRTDDVWGARRTGDETASPETGEMGRGAATHEISRTPLREARDDAGAEAPTRRYDNVNLPTSYPSVFVPPTYAPPAQPNIPRVQGNAYVGGTGAQPSPHSFNQPPTSRPVANLNLPENVVLLLPYLPFPVVGAVVGAVLLFLLPRTEPRARFHASQGLALHLIVLAVSILTSTFDDFLSGPAAIMLKVASAIFSLTAFVFFIISMIRVYKGEPHVVGPVSQFSRWLEEKIEPRK